MDFRLYLITDRHVAAKPVFEAVRLALEGGVRAVQLREKDLPVRELLALAQELRGLTQEYGARLLINDRVDVAVAVGADGVHLGHRSIPVAAARRAAGRELLIGASTHSLAEAKAAADEGADFITFGPIYDTPSKAGLIASVGIAALKDVADEVRIPVFALGGMKIGNIKPAFEAGAYGVAMISAILGADDIAGAAARTVEAVHILEQAICNSCRPR